jgi:predicted nucleic acid-binding protein
VAPVSLDSSFLIDLLNGEARAAAKSRELDTQVILKAVTPPAAAEVMIGAYHLGRQYLVQARRLLDALPLLSFDGEAIQEAGRLGAELLRRGEPLSQADLFIAAITKRHGHSLLTTDHGFVRVPGLSVETY